MNSLIEKTDSNLVAEIGKYIKHHRLRQNKTQEDLATHSGVKRLTLSKIENGGAFNAITMIKLFRSLDLLDIVMEIFTIPDIISPTMYIKMEKNSRKRARHLNAFKNNSFTKNIKNG